MGQEMFQSVIQGHRPPPKVEDAGVKAIHSEANPKTYKIEDHLPPNKPDHLKNVVLKMRNVFCLVIKAER